MSWLCIAITISAIPVYSMWVVVTYYMSAPYAVKQKDDIVGYFFHLCKKLNTLGKVVLFVLFIPALTFHYSYEFIVWVSKKIFFKKDKNGLF